MTTKRAPRKRKELDITNDIGEHFKKNFDVSNISLRKLPHLTDNQLKFYYLTQCPKTNMVFVDGPAGTAKAQPLSEPIPTPNGWVTMGDLKSGDYVFDVDGLPTKVLGVFPQGEKEIFKVTFSDGTYTRCCGDHLWSTSTYLDRNRGVFKRIDGKKIRMSKIPPIYKFRNTLEIMNSLDHGGRVNHMIPIISNPVKFNNEKKLPINPYIFGILLGDGSFRCNPVRISTVDEEIVEYFKSEFGDRFTHLKKCDYQILGLKVDIDDLNMMGHYSYDKYIPDMYKTARVEDRIELLQGLLDSDGSASKRGLATFSSSSKKLIDDVIEIINSLGGISYMIEKPSFLNGVEHKLSYLLHINLPDTIQPFKLKRKLSRYKPNTKYSPKKYIKNVEKIGSEECQCILVESEDHLYLTRNYIVTHNTQVAVYGAMELLKNREVDKIIYIRTVVESSSKSMGFLPGELDDKLSPYSMPLIDKLNEMTDVSTHKALMEQEYIKVIPVNFARGLTFQSEIHLVNLIGPLQYLLRPGLGQRCLTDSRVK
jgi:hypothetical protein